jgi:hypothetical protein
MHSAGTHQPPARIKQQRPTAVTHGSNPQQRCTATSHSPETNLSRLCAARLYVPPTVLTTVHTQAQSNDSHFTRSVINQTCIEGPVCFSTCCIQPRLPHSPRAMLACASHLAAPPGDPRHAPRPTTAPPAAAAIVPCVELPTPLHPCRPVVQLALQPLVALPPDHLPFPIVYSTYHMVYAPDTERCALRKMRRQNPRRRDM